MGTRADFYVKNGSELKQSDWLGSISWDGYPIGIDRAVRKAKSVREFKTSLQEFFDTRNDVTYPKDGWPWPWVDSGTTDYAYVFDKKMKKVHWKQMPYPDMSKIQNVAGGKRSGLIVIGGV